MTSFLSPVLFILTLMIHGVGAASMKEEELKPSQQTSSSGLHNITVGTDADLKKMWDVFPQSAPSVHVTVTSSAAIPRLAEVKEKLVTPLKARGVERIEITFQKPIQYSISNETDLKTLISIKEDLENVTLHGMVAMVQNLNLICQEHRVHNAVEPGANNEPFDIMDRLMSLLPPEFRQKHRRQNDEPLVTWTCEPVMNALPHGGGLSFEGLRMGSDGIHALAEALKVNGTIRSLDLRLNQIGDAEAQVLAEALQDNKTLQSLDIRWNQMGDAARQSLLDLPRVKSRDLTITF